MQIRSLHYNLIIFRWYKLVNGKILDDNRMTEEVIAVETRQVTEGTIKLYGQHGQVQAWVFTTLSLVAKGNMRKVNFRGKSTCFASESERKI